MPFISKASLWEKSPAIRLVIPFICGIIFYDKINFEVLESPAVILILSLAFLLILIVSIISLKFSGYKVLQFFAAQIFLVFLACCICNFGNKSREGEKILSISDSTAYALAIVAAEPVEKNKTIKFELNILQISNAKTAISNGSKAFVYVYKTNFEQHFQIGDTLLLPCNWQKITNTGNPFEMDYQKFCARKNIFLQQFIPAEQMILYGKVNPDKISFLQKAHQYCISTIEENIKDSTANALLKAMLAGDERDIDPLTRQAYSDTGIIHIVSISGAHVAMLFSAIALLFKLLRNKKYVWIQFVLSLALVWFYVLLAGASTPALRAAIMFTIIAVGTLAGKQNNPLNQLFIAAFIMLLFQPLWLFTIGFQLSFIAVLSLIIFYQPINSLWQPHNKILKFISNAIAASLAAEILVAPLVAYYFHSFPPMFIVANLLAAAAMGAILMLGMILLIVGKIAVLAKLLSVLVVICSQLFHYCIYALQCFNVEALKTIFLFFGGMLLLYAAILSFSIFILQKKKTAIWITLPSLLLFSLLVLNRSYTIAKQKKLIVFNSNKEAHAELFTGKQFTVYSGNSAESYAAKNAQIGFGISQKSIAKQQNLLILNNRKILFADSNTLTEQAFPVDILVITSSNKYLDAKPFITAFSPSKIVIVNNQNKWQVKEWTDQCALHRIALHNTRKDGAFIFP